MPYNVQMTEVELFTHLDNPTHAPLVITSNARAAHTLRNHYSQWQQEKQNKAWRTPRIQSWDTWLTELWDELILVGAEQQMLVTPAQERHLWRSILRSADATESNPVFDSNSLAELALDCFQLMEEFCISPSQLEAYADGKDTQAYLQWLRAFRAQSKKRGLLSSSSLTRVVSNNLERINLSASREFFFIGFDRVTPQQQLLLQSLQQQGCSYQFLWLTPEAPFPVLPAAIAAETIEEELHAAACWIRKRLLQNPYERIGVLTPSISELRDDIDRKFRNILAPSTLNVHRSTEQLPYEFTLGVPLSTLPQVRAALLLLCWLTQPIAFDDASFLLVANHVGGASLDARARLDAALRADPQILGAEPEFEWLLQQLRENRPPTIAPLHQSMLRVAALAREAIIDAGTSSHRTHAAWREFVDQVLQAAQWTLLSAKNSAEFQLLEKWNRMMDEIAALDVIDDSASFLSFLATLESTAARTLHALETHEAPVQIMGIAESAGMTFDAIWFLQASARAWPQRGRAQPWIPWQLQRQAAIPYVNAQADYDHACQVTQRVLASCKEIVFSFAMEDEAEESGATRAVEIGTRISPILQDVLPNTVPVSALPDLAIKTPEQIADQTLPVDRELSVPFTNAKVRHGVRFLKQQAACPFQAFAELRLGATGIEEPSLGLSARIQGSAVHEVLRLFWTQVQTQAALLALATEERRAILNACIQQTLSKIPANTSMEESLLSTEAERLCERLLVWLEVEAARPDFSVEACEKSIVNAVIGDLQFDCRIDRIDKVGDGFALLDYKTGQVSTSACDGERPDEPQLPAYAVLMRNTISQDTHLHGVAFASLQAKQPSFRIIHSLPKIFSTVTPKKSKARTPTLNTEEEFQDQVDQWSHTLTKLADQFRAGYAIVDPKIPDVTCTHCSQKILCRIQEAQLMANPTSEEYEEVEDSAETES